MGGARAGEGEREGGCCGGGVVDEGAALAIVAVGCWRMRFGLCSGDGVLG